MNTSSHPAESLASAAPRAEKLDTRAAGIVALAVMASRVLGVAREQIFAALFGGGALMDAFTMAFRIPNLLRDLFAEGALSTAFVTIFSKTMATEGDRAAWRLANKVATLTVITLSAITIAGIVFAPWLVSVLAGGWAGAKAELTIELTRVMFPFILLVSLAALVMGLLNARSIFGVPAMASSFFNLGSIITGVALGWWLDPTFGEKALLGVAIGTLIGGVLQFAIQLPSVRGTGYRFRPDFAWRDQGVEAILRLMGPSVVAASATQVNVLVNSSFASHLPNGSVYWLSIAFRLMQLPLGIFGVALGTVALPLLARMAVAGNTVAFRSELARGMRLAFLLTIPASIGLILLAGPIMSVLYQHGHFTAFDAGQAAGALEFYALGLCGYAALKVLVNAFYAIDRRKTPMVVSFFAIGLNYLLNWLFTMRLHWGHRGLAFSTACVATSNFLILYFIMRRHLGRLESAALLSLLARLAGACAVLAAVCWAGNHFLLAHWATERFWPKFGQLLAVIVVGAAAFFACATAFGIRELEDVSSAVKRRLARAVAR
ncbi:MAG TPA: murein biosynthesis integral membrane protein MurJ [Steroidobacteraceae bacterium]|nr:murein biosynthesis integral membrane protein MurJ [Steroidobacteraceae bacterium]